MTGNNLVRKPPVLIFTGPATEPGKILCLPGVMLWKTAALEYYVSQKLLIRQPTGAIDINPAAEGNSGTDKQFLTLKLDIGQEPGLCYADVRGMSAIVPMLGVVDVCWTHLAGIGMAQASRIAAATPGLPPGFGG